MYHTVMSDAYHSVMRNAYHCYNYDDTYYRLSIIIPLYRWSLNLSICCHGKISEGHNSRCLPYITIRPVNINFEVENVYIIRYLGVGGIIKTKLYSRRVSKDIHDSLSPHPGLPE